MFADVNDSIDIEVDGFRETARSATVIERAPLFVEEFDLSIPVPFRRISSSPVEPVLQTNLNISSILLIFIRFLAIKLMFESVLNPYHHCAAFRHG